MHGSVGLLLLEIAHKFSLPTCCIHHLILGDPSRLIDVHVVGPRQSVLMSDADDAIVANIGQRCHLWVRNKLVLMLYLRQIKISRKRRRFDVPSNTHCLPEALLLDLESAVALVHLWVKLFKLRVNSE